MKYSIITLFPAMFDSYLNESMLKRAQEKGLISFSFVNHRDFAFDKHKTVDDSPYGGGPGMVIKAEPILKAVDSLDVSDKTKIILFSPSGEQFTNANAKEYAENNNELVFICGRYEGIDARVQEALVDKFGSDSVLEISVGPYVLTGGELPAMIVIDSVSRQIPGVLGNELSPEERRIASPDTFTKPEAFVYEGKEYRVPEVLVSGNHAKIEEWRKKKGSTYNAEPGESPLSHA